MKVDKLKEDKKLWKIYKIQKITLNKYNKIMDRILKQITMLQKKQLKN